jgi:hypothetical protein
MAGLEPITFGGRSRELEFFEAKLNRAIHKGFCEHFLVLGGWGIGKSTLLREYKKIAQSRGCISCIVPVEPLLAGTELREAARSIVEGILRDLPYTVDRFKRVSDYFASAGVTVLGTGLQFSRNTSKNDLLPQSFLCDTLTRLWQDLEDRTGVLMVLLDDLENLAPVSEILMTLRQTLSMEAMRKVKILFGMTTTQDTWLNITSRDKPHHPLDRYFMSRVELVPLSEQEMSATIRKSLSGTAVSFSEQIVALVHKHTRGHPFEMQVLCSHLFDYQLSGQVQTDVWDKALQSTLADMGNVVFARWYEQASPQECKLLHVLSGTDEALSAREIREIVCAAKPIMAAGSVSKCLKRLTEKHLVKKNSRDLYFISDPMFRAYTRFLAAQQAVE